MCIAVITILSYTQPFQVCSTREYIFSGNGNTSSEDFEAKWYLLENHHGTSFDDLKAGLAHLKHKAGQRNEGPKEFLKINLTTFLDCYQTLTGASAAFLAFIQSHIRSFCLKKNLCVL